MEEDYISEDKFAVTLIKYVQNNQDHRLKNTDEAAVPDHWVASAEGVMDGIICAVHHGLFDTTFRKRAIISAGWFEFERQYRSPEADLVERIYHECQTQGVADWTPEPIRRNAFHVTHDFWSKATQERNYRIILGELKGRGLITEPTKSYVDEPNAIGLRVGDRVVDIPGSYRYFQLLRDGIKENLKYRGDFPQDIAKYDGIVPVVFMVGDTIDIDDDGYGEHNDLSPKQQLFQLVAENTIPTPKYQSIMYVFGEKAGAEIKPRSVGNMKAFMLEFYGGTPSGHILCERRYSVPQDDLSEEERESLDNRHWNWNHNYENILKNHPKIQVNNTK